MSRYTYSRHLSPLICRSMYFHTFCLSVSTTKIPTSKRKPGSITGEQWQWRPRRRWSGNTRTALEDLYHGLRKECGMPDPTTMTLSINLTRQVLVLAVSTYSDLMGACLIRLDVYSPICGSLRFSNLATHQLFILPFYQ